MLNTNSLQLYGIKYSYQIEIILERIYLTHIWDPNRYYYSRSELPCNEGVLYTLQKWNLTIQWFLV